VCYLAKLEVECEVLVFVLDSQYHVSSLVAGALPEVEQLLANLDIGVNCASHHLDLQVLVLDALTVFAKADNS
jgi:hypothetical protein